MAGPDELRLSSDVDRVGVDFDGVLNNIHDYTCTQIRDRYGIEYYPENISEWDDDLPNGRSFTEEIKPLIDSEDDLHRTEMVSGARDGMKALTDAGYTVVIVTHRPQSIHEPIREWLADRNIPYHEFVADVPHNKGLVDTDLLIEDRPLNVRNVLSEGKHAIHFTGVWSGTLDLDDAETGRVESAGVDSRPDSVESRLLRADSWPTVRSHLDC